MNEHQPYIILVANEKGGAGKTTTSMHIIVSLLYLGFKVGSVDVDARQQSLTRYLSFRARAIEEGVCDVPLPYHRVARYSLKDTIKDREEEEKAHWEGILSDMKDEKCDVVVIDTPGNDHHYVRLVHRYAHTLITPVNDSFIDLDVIGQLSPKDHTMTRPSSYSAMVWEQKMQRTKIEKEALHWIVLRNRLSGIEAKNKRHVDKALEHLASRLGFRYVSGFKERVIFRELFLKGLTLLDIGKGTAVPLTTSHLAARLELKLFLQSLEIPFINKALAARPHYRVPKKEPA